MLDVVPWGEKHPSKAAENARLRHRTTEASPCSRVPITIKLFNEGFFFLKEKSFLSVL